MKELVIYPDDDLRKVSEPVTDFGEIPAPWIEDMFWVMRNLVGNAVGISGIQCRIPFRIALLETNFGAKRSGMPAVICNPQVLERNGVNNDLEGCLSFPGKFTRIKRPEIIKLQYQDHLGHTCKTYFKGLQARCVLHEIDHMDGKLFIDELAEEERKRIVGE